MRSSIIAAFIAISISAPAASQEVAPADKTVEHGATNQPGTIGRAGDAAQGAIRQTGEGLADAALSPLEDLNLRRDEIPPLLASLKSPYEMPHEFGCYEIDLMVRDLDEVLGPDWDADQEEKRAWNERVADGAAKAALNTVSSEASGMIPFRGVVRKLSQAEKHAKAYATAFKMGGQRRAFLKGLGYARNCTGHAAPRPDAASEGDNITYRPARTQTIKTTRRVVRKPSTPSAD